MWRLASSSGMLSSATWSICVSLASKASCIDCGSDSKTSTGSSPPGPRRSSRESSSPSSACCARISLRLSTARFWMRVTKPATASSKPLRYTGSAMRLKNGRTTSRGCRCIDWPSSVMCDRICELRAARFILSGKPFISSSRHDSSRYDCACSCNKIEPFAWSASRTSSRSTRAMKSSSVCSCFSTKCAYDMTESFSEVGPIVAARVPARAGW
mmetsp:Transcript_5187/g.21368  ORF Transcript_5187/g.21368 Transcript_5187/m.21368 type:complete len:213 (-) Transcript_5187:469-1107(-)